MHVDFTAQRACVLAGRRFRAGDTIRVTPAPDAGNIPDIRFGQGGPWGWGGYTSRYLRSVAARIVDLQTGFVIYTAFDCYIEEQRHET